MLNRIKSETILSIAFVAILIFLGSGCWLMNNKAVIRNEDAASQADIENKTIASLHFYLDLYFHTGNRFYTDLMKQRLETIGGLGEKIERERYEINALAQTTSEMKQSVDMIGASLDTFRDKGMKFIEPDYIAYQNIAKGKPNFTTEELYQLETIKKELYNLERLSGELLNKTEEAVRTYQKRISAMANASLGAATIILLVVFLNFRRNVFKPLQNLTGYAGNISNGNLKDRANIKSRDLLPIKGSLDKIIEHISRATDFAVRIGEGKLDVEDQHIKPDDYLGKALLDMRNKLKTVADEENKRNWAVNGEAKFGEIFRQYQHAGIEELSYQFIFHLAKYTEANQGAVFLLAENEEDPFIEMTACYAYERKKKLEKRIMPGEGLVGQCILEKDVVYLEEVPENYINITSGLGAKTPTCVLLAPLQVNDEVFGAIELAFFDLQDRRRIAFVQSVCESFSATLSSAKMSARTQKLLDDSQALNQELQQQEELMRQNAEELQTTQEELNRKLTELEEETNLSKNIVEAINKTNATIEFDMDGVILDVNDMYLSVMGYSRGELIGKNEITLAPQDEIDSHRFRMLWDSLKAGTFMSGEYRRLSKGGREVWLNGAYNPIFNLEGKPYKIILLAQFTTEEKEKDLDMSSKINAISGSFPIIELDMGGKIKSANQTFIDLLGYKRSEFRDKELTLFTDKNAMGSASQQNLFVGTEEVSNTIIPYLTCDGKRIFCLTIQNPIRNLSGEIYKIMIILVNFSEQKSLETKLMENRRKLSSALDNLEDAQMALDLQKSELETHVDILNESTYIVEVNPDGLILQANEAACGLLKPKEADLTSESIVNFLAEEEAGSEFIDTMKKQAAGGKISRASLAFRNASGEIFPTDVTMAPIVTRDGSHLKTILVIFDVAAGMKTNARDKPDGHAKNTFFHWEEDNNDDLIQTAITRLLEQTTDHQSLDQIAGSGIIPVVEIDNSGKILKISQLALQLLGVSKADVRRKRLDELLSSDQAPFPQDLLSRLLKGSLIKCDLHIPAGGDGQEVTLLSAPVFTEGDPGIKILVFLLSKSLKAEANM